MPPGEPDSELYADDRIPALIKHHLLGSYLFELAIKMGRGGLKSLFFLDGFAGPWGASPSCADTSFGVAARSLGHAQQMLGEKWGKILNLHGFLIEKSTLAFPKLEEYACTNNSRPIKWTARRGNFEDYIDEIYSYLDGLGPSTFRFLLLDPKGWKGLAMGRLSTIAKAASSEILVNVMVRHLLRFLKEPDRAESYYEFFGRDDVRGIVLDTPKEERPDALVREYCKSLKSICGYRYVSSCMVLNEDKSEVRYYMVYGTNHHRGVEVFKDAETEASKLQSHMVSGMKKRRRESKHGIGEFDFFEESAFVARKRAFYERRAFAKIETVLRENKRVLYAVLFCEAAAYPLVTKQAIHEHLRSLSYARFELEPDPKPTKRLPHMDREDYYILIE